jgi:hypothetical protein
LSAYVPGRHHPLAGFQSVLDHHPAAQFLAQFDDTRLEAAVLLDEHRGLTLHQHHRPFRQNQGLDLAVFAPDAVRGDGGGGEHLRFEPTARIGDLDPGLDRARLLVHHCRDVGELALEGFAGIGVDGNRHIGARLDAAEILLEQVGLDPQAGKIGDREHWFVRGRQLAEDGVLLDHRAGKRRAQRER